ncbi:UMP phosphatase [Serratia fonticola]|uniref:UMP phosphatase n=1 Tax=Serratia fonticola TaxID=47917 RepID=A0A4U9U3B3_SERFO|nr:UMP phosphatase [Serratia fonticola]
MQGHSEETVIVGDNLRTDILAGFQAGLETVLVLSGVSNLNDVESMPFRPSYIFPSVADITNFLSRKQWPLTLTPLPQGEGTDPAR